MWCLVACIVYPVLSNCGYKTHLLLSYKKMMTTNLPLRFTNPSVISQAFAGLHWAFGCILPWLIVLHYSLCVALFSLSCFSGEVPLNTPLNDTCSLHQTTWYLMAVCKLTEATACALLRLWEAADIEQVWSQQTNIDSQDGKVIGCYPRPPLTFMNV